MSNPPFLADAFRRIGWAFLFLNITVGPRFLHGQEVFIVDMLPDFVGYLMIASAADRLVRTHRGARGARNLTLALAYLTIPQTVQYSVVTSQSGGLTFWHAPLGLLTILTSVLELVLVWILCGMVADLARRAGDDATVQTAYTRRSLYVALRVLMTAGVVFALVSARRDLVIGGALVVVGIGLVLLCLMVGLMRRAARLCEAYDLADNEPVRPGGVGFWLLFAGAIVLPVALAVGVFFYYQAWSEARDDAREKVRHGDYWPVQQDFYAHLLAGRIDTAYESTTEGFKTRISRAQLARLAQQYADYVNRPKPDRLGSGAGSSGGGYDYLTKYEYTEIEKGKHVQVTITIRRDRDSILHRQPPPLKVDDFNVEEKVAPQRQWP